MWEYETIARHLLAGDGLAFGKFGTTYHTLVVPLFPALCAALHWVGGPGFIAYFAAQLLLAAVFLLLLRWLTEFTAGENAGALAVLLAAFNPGLLVYHSYKVDPALLTGTCMVGSILLFLAPSSGNTRWGPFVSGVLAGLGTLSRPDALAVATFPWAFAFPSERRIEGLSRAIPFTLGLVVCLTPWLVRNYHRHGRIVMVSAAGQHLWVGNNPMSTGTLWTKEGKPILDPLPESLRDAVWGKDEMAQSDLFHSAAISHIKADPVAALGRWARNVVYFWTLSPDYSRRAHYESAPAAIYIAAHLVFPVLVLLALLARLDWASEPGRATTLLWVIPISLSLIHAPHYVEGRHRLLALPFIIILAAKGILRFRDSHAPTRTSS